MKFFLAKERASREVATMSCEEEKKPLVFALASNLTFMQMTAVKCVKLLITKVTKYSNLANM